LAQRELEHAGNLKGDVEDVHAGIQSKVDRQDTNGNALVNADTTARALTNGVSGNLPKTRDLAVNEDTNAGALMDGGPSSKETSVCSKCRAPMNPKYTFCNKCGQAVNTAQTAASSLPSPPPPPKTRDLAIGSSSSNSNSNSNSNNKSSSKIAPTSPSLQLPEVFSNSSMFCRYAHRACIRLRIRKERCAGHKRPINTEGATGAVGL
jgi:hypothetical protein